MIEVTIKDTTNNMCREINFSRERLETDGIQRMLFVQETSRMIGGFVQELKELCKEKNK